MQFLLPIHAMLLESVVYVIISISPKFKMNHLKSHKKIMANQSSLLDHYTNYYVARYSNKVYICYKHKDNKLSLRKINETVKLFQNFTLTLFSKLKLLTDEDLSPALLIVHKITLKRYRGIV